MCNTTDEFTIDGDFDLVIVDVDLKGIALTVTCVLARIDDRDYRVALDQAKADIQAAQALIDSQQGAVATQLALAASRM